MSLHCRKLTAGSAGRPAPAGRLLRHTPYHLVPLSMNSNSTGWYGNALLVRRDIEILDTSIVRLPVIEPRGAIRADLRVGVSDAGCGHASGLVRAAPPSAVALRLVPSVELRSRCSGSADERFQRMGAAPRVLPRIRQRMASAGTGQELSDPTARGIHRMAGHRSQSPSQRACRKRLRSLARPSGAAAAQ